jgi:hypothetical protein
MVLVMRRKAVGTLGARETRELVAQIRERPKGRFGAGRHGSVELAMR